MKYLELTFADPAQNLALDEALLDASEKDSDEGVLRIWEPQTYFIVLGYSNRVNKEVDVAACRENGIPIFRRFSGGGAVLQGPGCLNYTLVLKNPHAGVIGDIGEAYTTVLKRHQILFQRLLGKKVQIEGISDLAVDGQKFSGNAQHRRHRHVLVHGSFLLSLNLVLVEACLRIPSRQPRYRENRSHKTFLKNLHLDNKMIREGLKQEWRADCQPFEIPYGAIDELVKKRYAQFSWNQKF